MTQLHTGTCTPLIVSTIYSYRHVRHSDPRHLSVSFPAAARNRARGGESQLEAAWDSRARSSSSVLVSLSFSRTCQESINGSTHRTANHPSPNSELQIGSLHLRRHRVLCTPHSLLLSEGQRGSEPGRRRMQQQQPARGRSPGGGGWAAAATVDEASMERSKSFIKALQELKNLRPQLYSASEYCEKSYLHAQQKQMVLDNLKDYAVRAVVNAVDHLGTVAYKLTDLFEQQASEISAFELKVARLNQQIFTCQVYVDKEGLRQQQMMGANMKHHKHYILPSTSYKRTQAVAHLGTDTNQESKPRPYPSAKTLSWHLASDNSPSVNGAQKPTFILGDNISSKPASDGLFLFGKELPASPMRKPLQSNHNTRSDVTQKGSAKDQSGLRHMTTFSSFDGPKGREIQKVPVGTKSMLTALFIKHKSVKMKKISAR